MIELAILVFIVTSIVLCVQGSGRNRLYWDAHREQIDASRKKDRVAEVERQFRAAEADQAYRKRVAEDKRRKKQLIQDEIARRRNVRRHSRLRRFCK